MVADVLPQILTNTFMLLRWYILISSPEYKKIIQSQGNIHSLEEQLKKDVCCAVLTLPPTTCVALD